jgi:uncharacterized membrane protein (UPF0127 family)
MASAAPASSEAGSGTATFLALPACWKSELPVSLLTFPSSAVMRFCAIILFFFMSAPVRADMPVRQLEVDGNTIIVEVAHTDAARESGLMHRQSLAENHGMLFVFTEPESHSMWMMNTSIPLSVAFLDRNGIILNISDMLPHTVTPHRSAGAAKYALEVNLGWFKKRNVKSGSRVTGLKKVPKAE